jgi:hypothetical protein
MVDPFAVVRVNDSLTLDFIVAEASPSRHYAFAMTSDEFALPRFSAFTRWAFPMGIVRMRWAICADLGRHPGPAAWGKPSIFTIRAAICLKLRRIESVGVWRHGSPTGSFFGMYQGEGARHTPTGLDVHAPRLQRLRCI